MAGMLRRMGKSTTSGGGESRDWLDLGKSWDEAETFQATPAGREGEVRNLTGGKLKWCALGAMEGTDDDQPDGQNALHAIAAIEKQTAAGKPWFIGAGFHRPHDPFLVPKKYFDLYPPGSLKLYRDPGNITALPPLSIRAANFAMAFDAFTDPIAWIFCAPTMQACPTWTRRPGGCSTPWTGSSSGTSTLVIFSGDNGYHHNERNWWNKNTLFERSCRVPLIVAWPARGPAESATLWSSWWTSIRPWRTFATCQAPHKLAGGSLRPLLEAPTRRGPGGGVHPRHARPRPIMAGRSAPSAGVTSDGATGPTSFTTRRRIARRRGISPLTRALHPQFDYSKSFWTKWDRSNRSLLRNKLRCPADRLLAFRSTLCFPFIHSLLSLHLLSISRSQRMIRSKKIESRKLSVES